MTTRGALSPGMRDLLAWALADNERTFVLEHAGEWGMSAAVYRRARTVHQQVLLGESPPGRHRNTWGASLRGLERRGLVERGEAPGLPPEYRLVTVTTAGVRAARRLGLLPAARAGGTDAT